MPTINAVAIASLFWLSSVNGFVANTQSTTTQARTLEFPQQHHRTTTCLFMATRDTTEFDYYRILGVSRKATSSEIKQAYRRLAKQYHPDANNGSADYIAKFQALNRAYEVLKDPRMRMHYDIKGEGGIGTSSASDDIKRRRRTAPRSSSTYASGYGSGGTSSSSYGNASSSSKYGAGFGDFSSSSKRHAYSDFDGYKSEDHTHVEFGDMSDPYYRGRGKGPFQGSSMPSDQQNNIRDRNFGTQELHVGRGSRSDGKRASSAASGSTARSSGGSASSSSSSANNSKTKRPFSDERFFGKQPEKADSFFGGNRPGYAPGRTTVGDDIRVDWEIDLRMALFGGQETIRYNCRETCTTCEGSGAAPDTDVSTCQVCDGNGSMTQILKTPRGTINSPVKCNACKGTGKNIESPCVSCSSQGTKKATKQVNITVPAFMEEGTMVRLLGEGNPGPNGGPPGDLYVFLWAKDDPTFYREGDKIYSEESIHLVDAVLGCTVETPFVKFEVPPRTQHDHVVRLKGQGAPKKANPKERGDHLVTIKVEIPQDDDLTKEEEALYKKLRDLRDKKVNEKQKKEEKAKKTTTTAQKEKAKKKTTTAKKEEKATTTMAAKKKQSPPPKSQR